MSKLTCRASILGLLSVGWITLATAAEPAPLKVLFLGDKGHHRPADRAKQLIPVLAKRGIDVRYTDDVKELNLENLKKYQALIVYANIDKIAPEQEKALLDYVAEGGGFVPLHCASFCFRNSPKSWRLVGGQFKSHGTGVFRDEIVEREHPIMKGFGGFESWDETYVHTKHNEKDRIVLEYRVETRAQEPWTWVRTHGKGRVFYTAWGHDERTWSNPGFQNLRRARHPLGGRARPERRAGLSAGRQHAANSDAAAAARGRRPTGLKPFEYVETRYRLLSAAGNARDTWNQMQLPLSPEESLKHLVLPDGFRGEAVRRRAGACGQADLHELGRARPAVDRRDGRLSERVAAARARAATGFASAKTPTATAGPTSSPSSPTSSAFPPA